MPAPRARGSPGRTWPPRTRGDAEQGAARPQPRDDLPGGPRSLGAAQGQVSTRCHLEATRGSTTAPWKGWAVAAEPGSPSGQPERRDSQDRKPHGDQWHWKRSPATSFRLGPQRLQTQQPGDEDRRRQREAQRAHPGGLRRHARRREALSASPSLPVTAGFQGGLTAPQGRGRHGRARVPLRGAAQGGLQAQQSLAGPAAVRLRCPWSRQPSAAQFLKVAPVPWHMAPPAGSRRSRCVLTGLQ